MTIIMTMTESGSRARMPAAIMIVGSTICCQSVMRVVATSGLNSSDKGCRANGNIEKMTTRNSAIRP